LFINGITQKLHNRFSQNSHGPRKKSLYFGGNPDHVTFGLGLWWGECYGSVGAQSNPVSL